MTPRRWGWDRWALVPVLLLGWALRLPPILDNRFHPDEALYGYWAALIGQGQDPWLAAVPVYKPPLLPYLVAGAQALLGNSEFALRMPGLAAGLLTIPLVAALSRALYHEPWTTAAAAVGVALSPFAILFSATAFPDPLMVALGLGTCVVAAHGQPGRAGLLAGLAFAAKQTGLMWVPLALGIGLIQSPKPKAQSPNRVRRFAICHLPFAVSFSLLAALVFIWDGVRVAQGAESFWRMGITGYGGLRLIWPHELWTRLRDWAELARYILVSPVVNGALLVGLGLLVGRAVGPRRYERETLTDLLLGSLCLVYFSFHWLWAFPVWDRYLLPLVPVLALLLARTLASFASYLRSTIRHSPFVTCHLSFLQGPWSFVIGNLPSVICHLSFVILLLVPAWHAAHSRYPVGGDHGAYDGIDEVAGFLRTLPEGTVVYQHWLGWHYGYYLFDAPVYVAYWPTPAWLAQDVRVFGAREPRYIVFPSWESPTRVERALAGVGYGLSPVLTAARRDGTPSFSVCHIQPLSDL